MPDWWKLMSFRRTSSIPSLYTLWTIVHICILSWTIRGDSNTLVVMYESEFYRITILNDFYLLPSLIISLLPEYNSAVAVVNS
jgi:hypothetical protein